jgi:UDP-2,4-diacetamido-2,4,6-trideoxy-beta-L-altropyranose hydrolase
MAKLIAEADMAIGGAGSATWERCAMGLPSIIMVLAENQNIAAKDLHSAGVVINLGDARLITKTDLTLTIGKLLVDGQLRTDLSNASLQLVSISKQNELVEIIAGHHV